MWIYNNKFFPLQVAFGHGLKHRNRKATKGIVLTVALELYSIIFFTLQLKQKWLDYCGYMVFNNLKIKTILHRQSNHLFFSQKASCLKCASQTTFTTFFKRSGSIHSVNDTMCCFSKNKKWLLLQLQVEILWCFSC